MLMLEKLYDNIDNILGVVTNAAKAVMEIYKTKIEVGIKPDATPVTNADIISHDIICQGLLSLFPEIPIVSEESEISIKSPPNTDFFWLLDPIDGTKNFIAKYDAGFSINLGFIDRGVPVFGVLCLPALGELYYTLRGNVFKLCDNFCVNKIIPKMLAETSMLNLIVSSRSSDLEIDRFLKAFDNYNKKVMVIPSAIKYCYFLQTQSSIIAYFVKTYEWDSAAGHALLNTFGAKVLCKTGNELKYGKPGFKNNVMMCIHSNMYDAATVHSLLELL